MLLSKQVDDDINENSLNLFKIFQQKFLKKFYSVLLIITNFILLMLQLKK